MTRRNALTAALTAPFTMAAAAIAPTRKPDKQAPWQAPMIRQAELQSVFDDLKAIEQKLLSYRRRLLGGAEIEPGALTGQMDEDFRAEAECSGEWGEFAGYDLTIRPAKELAN